MSRTASSSSPSSSPSSPPLVTDPELLARLVGIDSTSHRSNRPVADLLADYLARPGVEIVRRPDASGDKVALLVRVGPPADREHRRGLVLSGHMDVVPAAGDWSSDPFTLTDRGDRWVGRGSADMKGFVALAANLAAELAENTGGDPQALAHPLVLILTYDEELGCLGARDLASGWSDGWDGDGPWTLPRAAIIGEPTSLGVVRRHKGHVKTRITLHGVTAHSGYAHLGDNAIVRAAAAVQRLEALGGELRREAEAGEIPGAETFPVPFPSLNVGTIEGGVAINIVPDRCALEVGLRLLPGMDEDAALERQRRAVEEVAGPEGFEVEVISSSPPLELAPDAPVHRALCELTGEAEGAAVNYGTDGGWLQTLDLDCAIWGPGSIEVAHKPDEFLPKDELAEARKGLERLIERFCRRPA